MKKLVTILLLAIFMVAFGVGYLVSVDTAGACKCSGRCSPLTCQAPCVCQRVGPCACLQCVCFE